MELDEKSGRRSGGKAASDRSRMQKRAAVVSKGAERIEKIARNIQLIADLSYADVLLCCKGEGGEIIVHAAAKPNTATSIYRESPVGKRPLAVRAISRAASDGVKSVGTERLPGGISVRVEATPIRDGDRTIAVVARERSVTSKRRPSEMERVYMSAADKLLSMIEEGLIDIGFSSSKEAGDGLIWVDTNGKIVYATPNAVTIYKRLGFERELVGEHVDELGLDEAPVVHAMREMEPGMQEVTERGMTTLKKAIPLVEKGRVNGVISIIRDVTDLRARELELRIKEATIREIHHRVKNNLQTIASLLRLQARRMSLSEAQEALLESVGRISSIAVVHEILSQRGDGPVDFMEIVRNIAKMVKVALVHPEAKVEIETSGKSVNIPAPAATALALVLTELLQNAVEHAFIHHPGPPS
ncbi:MAG: PAS domain-containing sensor histidine kinase, partial [Actinobacteria bacterium]|nr:PAS domain-containing sensor histidine kinase [Actinomycetota bacterium]